MSILLPVAQERLVSEKGLITPNWYRPLTRLFEAWNKSVLVRATGQLTVTGAATTGAATFAEQATATYSVSLTPASLTGAPAANATVIRSIAKTTTGITVTVDTAPGGVTAVTFDYVIYS